MCNSTYQAIYNKDGSLKHSNECKMAFGKKDAHCPRCIEMMNGAPSRAGWQKSYYSFKKTQDDVQQSAVAAHYAANGPHARGLCGPVCTFGD